MRITVPFKEMSVCAHSHLTLCDAMDYSPPGSSVHGILLAWILEWVAIPSSRESSQPRDQTHISYVSCTGRWVLYHSATWEALTPPLDYCFKKKKNKTTLSNPPGLINNSFWGQEPTVSPFVWQSNKTILFYVTQNCLWDCIRREVKLSVLNLTVRSMITQVSEDIHYQTPPRGCVGSSPALCWVG